MPRRTTLSSSPEGQHWTVKADTLPVGSGRRVADAVNEATRMHGVRDEERARELVAALHAALYEDLEPLSRAVTPAS